MQNKNTNNLNKSLFYLHNFEFIKKKETFFLTNLNFRNFK